MQVFLTDEHLGIVLEYATGGELLESVDTSSCFDEDMARSFFQQLVAGVEFIHSHYQEKRNAKIENTLIQLVQRKPGKEAQAVVKIADFVFREEKFCYGSYTRIELNTTAFAYLSPVCSPNTTFYHLYASAFARYVVHCIHD